MLTSLMNSRMLVTIMRHKIAVKNDLKHPWTSEKRTSEKLSKLHLIIVSFFIISQ